MEKRHEQSFYQREAIHALLKFQQKRGQKGKRIYSKKKND